MTKMEKPTFIKKEANTKSLCNIVEPTRAWGVRPLIVSGMGQTDADAFPRLRGSIIATKNEAPTENNATLLSEADETTGASKTVATKQKLNINLATVDQLIDIGQLAESRAQNIVDDREGYGPFKIMKDVERVGGAITRVFRLHFEVPAND